MLKTPDITLYVSGMGSPRCGSVRAISGRVRACLRREFAGLRAAVLGRHRTNGARLHWPPPRPAVTPLTSPCRGFCSMSPNCSARGTTLSTGCSPTASRSASFVLTRACRLSRTPSRRRSLSCLLPSSCWWDTLVFFFPDLFLPRTCTGFLCGSSNAHPLLSLPLLLLLGLKQ